MISATNQSWALVATGEFREDLYRLNLITIRVPPCANGAATSPLAAHIIGHVAPSTARPVTLTRRAMAGSGTAVARHPRQLKQTLERTVRWWQVRPTRRFPRY